MLSEVQPVSGAGPIACPAAFNLAAHVLGRASGRADRIALQIVGASGAERWSYGRLQAAVLGIAGGLSALGLAPGARILLRLGNTVEFPLAFLGAVAADLIPVACPAGLTVPEVTVLAAMVRPALVIVGDGVTLPDPLGCPVLTAAGLMALADHTPADWRLGSPDRPAYIAYTSGTTGSPRAVVHAHRAVWARRMMIDGWYGLTADDRMLHAGAFNWTFTLGTGLFDPWSVGATALVPQAGTRTDQLPLLLKRHDVTLFAAAPGVYRALLKSGGRFDLPKLRHGLAAGEHLADRVRQAWHDATGRPVYEAFGLSECSTFVSESPARPAPPGATGYAQPGRHVAILGAEGGTAPVPRGTPGTLAVHEGDPGLFLGYFGDRIDRGPQFRAPWFSTGDLARMDDDGAITILGRADDMMNAGGFRVAPGEVESALTTCPGVTEAAAVEHRIEPGKSIIVAFYTGPAAPAEVEAHAGRVLARYKQPRAYHPVDQLPHTPNGKINRRELRDMLR